MQSIPISHKTRMRLIEIRKENGFKSHDMTIKELLKVLDWAQSIEKERDELQIQVDLLKGKLGEGYPVEEQK